MKEKPTKTKARNKIRKESTGERIFDVFNTLFLRAVSIIAIYPLWYVICASMSDSSTIAASTRALLYPIINKNGALGFTFDAYKTMLADPNLISGYRNTIFIVVVGTTINVIMTAICAYVLSREGTMLKKPFTLFIMFTMFFNGGMIPTYMVYMNVLHLRNSLFALILPGAISVYNMIIMRTNFESIPKSLDEAARLDGAGHMRILFQIVIPLSKAIIAVMVLYYAVGHWNAWFNASLYIVDENKYPLQLVLRNILIVNDTSNMNEAMGSVDANTTNIGATIKYALIVFSTIPILCVYPFLQKHFTKGIMVGAVKG